MENLENECHHLHLIRVRSVSAHFHKHFFHERHEVLGDIPDLPLLLDLNVFIIRSAKLLKASQTNKLKTDILILHAFCDIRLAIDPLVIFAAVSLANVKEDVLQFRNDDRASYLGLGNMHRIEDVLLDEDTVIDRNIGLILLIIGINVCNLSVAQNILLVVLTLISWRPVHIDHHL